MKPRPGQKRVAQPLSAPTATPTPTPTPVAEVNIPATTDEIKSHAIVLTLDPDADGAYLLDKLESDLELKLTIIFPAGYFDTKERAMLIPRFSALQTSQQIDVALTLDNEPNLPLIADLS